jgi:hypothetical protein
MTQRFTLILKDNTQKAFNSFSWFLLFLHLVAAAAISINSPDKEQHVIAIGAIVLFTIIAGLLVLSKARLKLYHLLLFTWMIIFWLLLSAWLPAIVVALIILFAYRVLKIKSSVLFTSENIIITRSLFKKVYNWPEVENIVLKDHLLSIDLRNNQLFQTEIAAENYNIDEAAFNQFCNDQLKTLTLNSNPKL